MGWPDAYGHTGISYTTTTVDDDLFDGTQVVEVQASATGFITGYATTEIYDDDVHHYQIDPISGQTASVDFDITVKAMNIDDNCILVHSGGPLSLSAHDAGGPIGIDPTEIPVIENGVWTGPVAVHAVTSDVVLTATDGNGINGSSNAFDLTHGPLARYEFADIDPVQYANWPFDVAITACDANGYIVTDYTGPADLGAFDCGVMQTINIGTGTLSWTLPLLTWWHDARTQVIYLNSELNGPGTIDSLSLDIISLPPQTLNAWTIRMKHTQLDTYGTGTRQWETDDWTTVYQNNENISSTGWYTFTFDTPFEYNGFDNLMIDFCYNNSYYTSNASVFSTDTFSPRSILGYTDSGYGDPLNWSTSYGPNSTVSTWIPNIRLSASGEPLSVTPLSTGMFVDGVWNGSVTIHDSGSDVSLAASDGGEYLSASNTFVVESQPTVSIAGPTDVVESDGTLQGSVQIPFALTYDLTVDLTSSDTSELTLPSNVVITAGELSADYTMTVMDDSDLDWIRPVTLSASATDFQSSDYLVHVHDDETASMAVSIPDMATEGDGILVGQGMITISEAPTEDVVIELLSSDTTEVTFDPVTVLLQAGMTTTLFDLHIVEDNEIDDLQTVTIGAFVENWISQSDDIVIVDNENLDIIVRVSPDYWENAGTVIGDGMVEISGTLTHDLDIALSSNDSTELELPQIVTIHAGTTSTTFSVTIIDDSEFDGIQSVMIEGSATGFNTGSVTTQVFDDDIHHYLIDPIGLQTADVYFDMTIRAMDINDHLVTVHNGGPLLLRADDASGRLSIDPAVIPAISNGIWTGPVAVFALTTDASVTVTDENNVTGVSNLFDLIHGPVAYYGFDTIEPVQYADWPFDVTISAYDANGYIATDYTGTVDLQASSDGIAQTIQIGTGSNPWHYPMSTYYHDARTQVIYLSSELNGQGEIESLSLYVSSRPSQVMNNWTVRMKHTPLDSYGTGSYQWETTDWTTVYQGNLNVTGYGWVTFEFNTPFAYNGTDNLMIDFSYNNSYYTSDGYCHSTYTNSSRSIYYRTDSQWGNPLNWSSTYGPVNAITTLALQRYKSSSLPPGQADNKINDKEVDDDSGRACSAERVVCIVSGNVFSLLYQATHF